MAAPPLGRPSSARPSAVTGRGRGGSRSQRPHSARATLFLPHPPAQQPPDVAGGSGVRPTSAYRARLDYQKKLDQKREAVRHARAEEEREEREKQMDREKQMNAARTRVRKSTHQWRREEVSAAQAAQETSEPEDRVDEPTGSVEEPAGSFRRRRVAHDAVMQSLKQENPQADRRAAPPLGHEWRDLNRGLSNLFRTRAATSTAKKKKSSVLTGFRTFESAPIPLLRQKALSRQMGSLKEFYANGQAGRVLGEVDKSFAKRRANPDGVTKTWAMEVDKKREQLAPWAASNPEAVLGRTTETTAQRRERLRAEMAEKRRVRESKMTGGEDDVDSAFTLRTNEHASLGLQLALHREAREAKRQAKRKDVIRPIGPRVATEVESRVAACIVPLCEQAESKSVEVQRDVAAALYSLSIAEENKPAFVEAQALETLIAMAQSKDPDIRRNIAGAMYRLSMCTSIKRQFVELGVLRPLLVLAQGSKDREVQRYSMLAIKELSEKRANHSDILDAHALPILYTNLESTDPRIRKEAIWTLDHLADEENNRLRLLRSRALSVVLEHLQVQDVNVRRGSASTMLKFAKLLEVAPVDIVKELNSKKTLSALIDALKDRDLDVNTDLCKSLVIMKSATLIKLMLSNKGLVHVLSHANRLVSLDGTGAIHVNLTQVMTVLLTFMPAKVPQNVMVVMDEGYMSTLLHLCKYNSGKVRRSAGKLLARLSTIEASKAKMMADPEIVPLLNSLCKQSDYSSRMTAVKVIAELAEEPKNRLPLYLAAVLPTLFEQIRKGDDEMRFQCARAIADMAEAVELRVAIVYAGLELILDCMLSEDDQVQEQGMRILVNLAAPAGFACGAEAGEVGRYGALEALQVDDDLDETSSSDESCDSDDSADSSDEDSSGVGEDDAMDKIANMIGAPRFSALCLAFSAVSIAPANSDLMCPLLRVYLNQMHKDCTTVSLQNPLQAVWLDWQWKLAYYHSWMVRRHPKRTTSMTSKKTTMTVTTASKKTQNVPLYSHVRVCWFTKRPFWRRSAIGQGGTTRRKTTVNLSFLLRS